METEQTGGYEAAWNGDADLVQITLPRGQLHTLVEFAHFVDTRQIFQFDDDVRGRLGDDLARSAAGQLVLAFVALREANGREMV